MKKTTLLFGASLLLVLTACGAKEQAPAPTTAVPQQTTAQSQQEQSTSQGTVTQQAAGGAAILKQAVNGTLESQAVLDVHHGPDVAGTLRLTGQGLSFTRGDGTVDFNVAWKDVQMIIRDDDVVGMVDVKCYTNQGTWDLEAPSSFIGEMEKYVQMTVDY